MNIDEVMTFAPYVQGMMDVYAHNNTVAGRCFQTTKDLARATELLIKRRLPFYVGDDITVEIGNLSVDGVEQFARLEAERHAQNLPPIARGSHHTEEYHAWLSFRGAVIDLSIIYTSFAAQRITHLEPGVVFRSSDMIWSPQDYGFRHHSYRSWSLAELEATGYLAP